uniref:Tribytltin binding protein type 2 n=1 Tax=Sphoeroides pachygaster TaxID=229059 RepID=A0A0H5AJT1_SPHPC|nr:tribytltin binding protein type 2 [Sphoeroides pachygaster]
MEAVPVVVLLMLAVLGSRAAPGPEDCQNVTRAVAQADVQKFSGDWVLVWFVADNTTKETWKNLTSTYAEVRVHADGLMYTERNMLMGKECLLYYSNMSADAENPEVFSLTHSKISEKGTITVFNVSATVKFFETCADCMAMHYNGTIGSFLLIYRRDGQHQGAEVLQASKAKGENLAECLGLPLDDPFFYDGVADFCQKRASPEVEPQEARANNATQSADSQDE